jgi:hypothetical protein
MSHTKVDAVEADKKECFRASFAQLITSDQKLQFR